MISSRGRPQPSDKSQPSNTADVPAANVQALSLRPGRRVHTRQAGVFSFWPLLAQVRFDRIVEEAGYPGTNRVPPAHALLALLTLKLLDKERLCHIDDFNCDEDLGLFAGLNILPK